MICLPLGAYGPIVCESLTDDKADNVETSRWSHAGFVAC